MIQSSIFLALLALLAVAHGQDHILSKRPYEETRRRICMFNMPLICNLQPTTNSTVRGRVLFEPVYENGACLTRIRGFVTGLTPNTKQAIHIHNYGDLSQGSGRSLGGHFSSPGGIKYKHGLPGSTVRHWGDFGSLVADSNGDANYTRTDTMISIPGIVGRGMVVHAKVDLGAMSQPSGGAGSRKAMCVIGYANPDLI